MLRSRSIINLTFRTYFQPKTYKRISMSGHKSTEKKLIPKKIQHLQPETVQGEDEPPAQGAGQMTKLDRCVVAAATASPIEEQPLIPKSYLEQKKKLDESSEEQHQGNERRNSEDCEKKEAERRLTEAEDKRDVERRLKSFKQITENVYLCSRKISKQFRNMQCDCDLNRVSLFWNRFSGIFL
jgi:hypothetical protein